MSMLKRGLVLTAVLVGTSSAAIAQQTHAVSPAHGASAATDKAVGSHLPPKFRGLIIQEMLAVTEASKRILEALARGQDDVVARNAQQIHDSFVLEQEMTEAESKALHDALPHAFVERDQEFHALSAQLAEAARQGDTSRQLAVFAKMQQACIACHAVHATDRFPSLAGKRQ